MMNIQRLGPEVDTTIRPIPPRLRIAGRTVVLEPLGREHAADLWKAAQDADPSWTYLSYGPFVAADALEERVVSFATQTDPILWAVCPIVDPNTPPRASGWLALMDIRPADAAIELGQLWFSPRLQRTVAATEAMFLLLRFAAEKLGYRRLVWKCDALNTSSRRAAERLGFRYEGTLRAHMIIKGRERNTSQYSILAREWPRCRDAVLEWLQPDNFDADGKQRRSLQEIRNRPEPPASPVCYADEPFHDAF